MAFLLHTGINALSDFRARALLKGLQTVDKSITGVSAEYAHFVEAPKLSANDEAKLKTILTYGTPYSGERDGQVLLVVPRMGSISPWSSKATDIIHNCGLKQVARVERGVVYYISSDKASINVKVVGAALHDRMTESVLETLEQAKTLFTTHEPKPVREIDLKRGKKALAAANKAWGLALSDDDIDYLFTAYKVLKRNPTDAELMMFAQVNSEHCRHKIFNADWIIGGKKQPKSLFKMIKNTYEKNSTDILSAYSDNAAVLKGAETGLFFPDPKSGEYTYTNEVANIVIKVETHNHPTAIAPFPGSATGSGGEIRDEGATGRGAKPKIGLTGFSVSNLNIPGAEQPWEKPYGRPNRITSPLDIMIDAPLGGAAFNNEFGRPNLSGYFRTYEQEYGGEIRGYHKPIMIAGGLGNIRSSQIEKKRLPVGAKIIVLGGPAMLIGLGGGAASSMQAGASDEDLDFASVQRGNAEVQRRAQEVISACWALNDNNPIITIHDVGAGGWSNALPELVHDSGRGAKFELRDLPNAEPGMSPMEIWSNEAQERYVLGIAEKDLERFAELCARERCDYAVVGEATEEERLVVHDREFGNNFIDLPFEVLFGKSSKMTRKFDRKAQKRTKLSASGIDISEAVERVLHLPAVASKKFLITIGDRTVGGLCVRDQMVGPWQVPVADVAVSASGFTGKTGEAMTVGERTPLALIDAPASGRMAIGEAITNIAAAKIAKLSDVKLSANWMAATGYKQEDEHLYDTVKAVGEEFCPALGLTIPVGKDSLSMRTRWEENGAEKSVTAPLSLIISAFAPVTDVNASVTPQLKNVESEILFIDLGAGKQRFGGSALAQVYNQVGDVTPDADAELLKKFFAAIQNLITKEQLLAYHDRSDGGLLTTLAEMVFAGRVGLDIDVSSLGGSNLERLFNEELGAVIQVPAPEVSDVMLALKSQFGAHVHRLGTPRADQKLVIRDGKKLVYENTRAQLETWWAETSYRVQRLRDNPAVADMEFAAIQDDADKGLTPHLTFTIAKSDYKTRPKVAILREEGVNGQVEMAAAFDRAGFTAIDVHLNDLMRGEKTLDDFVGLVACGGFSYGDVLGAGEGWAKSILFHDNLRMQFKEFFEHEDTFSLGVCNGCQMLAALKELIPGAEHWPRFLTNESERFEARLLQVKVTDSPSIFFKGMQGSIMPIPVAHGEGRAAFEGASTASKELVSLQYVDGNGKPTEAYPANPNGSRQGITGLTTLDGRATIMMPHPERAFLTKQFSWHPADWGEDGPWLKMFQNARAWVETQQK